jgi:hypothetical protein
MFPALTLTLFVSAKINKRTKNLIFDILVLCDSILEIKFKMFVQQLLYSFFNLTNMIK